MSDQVFAVLLDEPNEQVVENLQNSYKNHYRHTDVFHLIAVDGDVLTREVATKIGIRTDPPIAPGVVIKVQSTAYSGFTDPALWEWLRNVNKE